MERILIFALIGILTVSICYVDSRPQSRPCSVIGVQFQLIDAKCLIPATSWTIIKDDDKEQIKCRCRGLGIKECIRCTYRPPGNTTTTTTSTTTRLPSTTTTTSTTTRLPATTTTTTTTVAPTNIPTRPPPVVTVISEEPQSTTSANPNPTRPPPMSTVITEEPKQTTVDVTSTTDSSTVPSTTSF
ncbi:unnamed protein product [Orchesella dallaii]|uniref:Uncharacterized protein n=1 Tax=Orchesella dallaii TaxID=48710 RepID=A0ABP1RGC8_9HEXA